jgi:hypothetical protein
MSLPRTRNALAEKIALWEERNQRMAAQLAAARPRSTQPRQTVADMRMGMGSVIARPVTGSGIVRPVAAPFDDPNEPSHNNTEDEKEREKHARERLRKEEEEEKARMDEEVKKELERMERELEGHRQQQDQERLRKQAEKLERDTKREVEARERERKEREEEECKAKEQQQQEEQRRKEEEEAKQRQALKSEKELELESRRLEDERLHKERLQREEKARLWRLREENKAAVKIQARWKASHEKRKFQVMRTYRGQLEAIFHWLSYSPVPSTITGKMNLYRTQVAQEILSTEENYVKTLREVVEVHHLFCFSVTKQARLYFILI